jgi:hypothetical protein
MHTLVAAVILSSAISMPPIVSNPWAENDWAPLRAAYEHCERTAPTYFTYYVCTSGAQTRAMTVEA